ncbi:hydrogenase maturation nickel metallochaperone HypA [Azospirillum sp. TSO35-2]|uniref:hydrogenase maturation nickel metallochaperone HypA n=1 Tax=Azospirillum sp. TSO35-2 TaxID=716796 RepID=UPI000D60ED2C|nr:hydrogenase maturation nickel metallochaperone HypA [Azospirillum sp. TSO35-2]PWC36090.1 hydrogenase nickel incorporation protein HypA [Azospirillum sp. TSO35-2]
MHEIAVCQSLLQQAMAARDARPFARVVRVSLSVGRLSRVEPEALQVAFDLLSRDTFLEGAALRIERPPGHAVCEDCGAESEVDSRVARCPACAGHRLRIDGGDGYRFIEMEVA